MLIPLFSFYECLKLRMMSIFLGWGLGGGGGCYLFVLGAGEAMGKKRVVGGCPPNLLPSSACA